LISLKISLWLSLSERGTPGNFCIQ
jgi:hypothetical protein